MALSKSFDHRPKRHLPWETCMDVRLAGQRTIEVYPVEVRWLPLLFRRAGGWAAGGLVET